MREKYYVEYVKTGYNTLNEARASACRVMDRIGITEVQIIDENYRSVGYVEYSNPGCKPYWKKAGRTHAYHVVEADGSIRRRSL